MNIPSSNCQALSYKKYSTASDVWSFGVLVFEIWSLGEKPFQRNSNHEVSIMNVIHVCMYSVLSYTV